MFLICWHFNLEIIIISNNTSNSTHEKPFLHRWLESLGLGSLQVFCFVVTVKNKNKFIFSNFSFYRFSFFRVGVMLSRGVMEDCEGIYTTGVLYTLWLLFSPCIGGQWKCGAWLPGHYCGTKKAFFLSFIFFQAKKDHSTLHAHLCLCLSFVPSHNNSTAICWLF